MAAISSRRYRLRDEPVDLAPGRDRERVGVTNTGDRPIQVGSHFHFFEVNRALRFDRSHAFGMRLDIPAGTAVRFEPGDTTEVGLVAFGGTGKVLGFNRLTEGSVRHPAARRAALERAATAGFVTEDEKGVRP